MYVDHAGATLYSEKYVRDCTEELTTTLFGNPRTCLKRMRGSVAKRCYADSQSESSTRSTAVIDDARRRVLMFFEADAAEWECVFTSGATASLKLLADSFPFAPHCKFVHTRSNHTSAIGIREYVAQ